MNASRKICVIALLLFMALLAAGLFACRQTMIVDTFTSPANSKTGGLAWYIGDLWLAGGDVIWRLDAADGSVKEFIDGPGENIIGLAPGDGHLWAVAEEPDNASTLSAYITRLYKIETTGKVIESFTVPLVFSPRDIAFDGTWIWLVSAFNNKIYKIDTEGTVVDSFFAPFDHPAGITFDGEYLWLSNIETGTGTGTILKLGTAGNTIGSFFIQGKESVGLACNGKSSLWLSSLNRRIYTIILPRPAATITIPFDEKPGNRAANSGAVVFCYFSGGSVAQRISNACSTLAVQLFSSSDPLVPSNLVPDSEQTLSFREEGPFFMTSYFSEEELLDIIENDRYGPCTDSDNPWLNRCLTLPAFSRDSEAGKQIMSLLFTPTEDYIMMVDPFTGENMYLFGIEYVKFKGSTVLIPVPPLLQ